MHIAQNISLEHFSNTLYINFSEKLDGINILRYNVVDLAGSGHSLHEQAKKQNGDTCLIRIRRSSTAGRIKKIRGIL